MVNFPFVDLLHMQLCPYPRIYSAPAVNCTAIRAFFMFLIAYDGEFFV